MQGFQSENYNPNDRFVIGGNFPNFTYTKMKPRFLICWNRFFGKIVGYYLVRVTDTGRIKWWGEFHYFDINGKFIKTI